MYYVLDTSILINSLASKSMHSHEMMLIFGTTRVVEDTSSDDPTTLYTGCVLTGGSDLTPAKFSNFLHFTFSATGIN